jgi:histidinol phosphatase-like enzyme (inositol monophosphatase family)
MPSNPTITERLDFAVASAQAAGSLTLKYFRRSDLAVESKSDNSPVTVADRLAEQLIRERLAEQYTDDGIIGEEFGMSEGTSGYQWILDPIDGTKSFIHGMPLYTTLVAVLQKGEPQIGVIHAPATGETLYAAKGQGCWLLDGKSTTAQPARVSKVAKLADSLLLTTDIEGFKRNPLPRAFDYYLKLQSMARLARTWGDGYGYLMVATGRAEVMIDPLVNLWDAAPLQTVIEEAGGRFTDWKGTPTIRAGEAIATNGLVAEEVLGLRE